MEKKTRFTTKIKTEIVLALLRGESIEALSRKYGVTIADLSLWRDQFIEQGAHGFKRIPEDSRLKEAERMIGQLQMELELTKRKNELVTKLRRR